MNKKGTAFWLIIFFAISLYHFCIASKSICCKEDRLPNKNSKQKDKQTILGSQKTKFSPWLDPSDQIIIKLDFEQTEAPHYLFWDSGSYIDPHHAWIGLNKTEDGGKTWQNVNLTSEARALWLGEYENDCINSDYKNECYFHWLNATFFITNTRGWLHPIIKNISGIWQTDDGGLTWKKISNGVPYFYFINKNDGWLFISIYIDERIFASKIYITNDSGKNWRECNSNINNKIQIDNAYFLTPKIGWAKLSMPMQENGTFRGYSHFLARTEDYGCTWNKIWKFSINLNIIAEIYFLNEQEGWIAELYEPVLFHTIDGGKSWNRALIPDEKIKIESIFFIDSNEGWIMDANENVYHTKNRGLLWNLLSCEEIKKGFPQRSFDGAYWKKGSLLSMLLQNKICKTKNITLE